MATAGIKVLLVGFRAKLPYETAVADTSGQVMALLATFRPDVIVTRALVPAVLNRAGLEIRRRWIYIDEKAPADLLLKAIENCYAGNLWGVHPLGQGQPLVSVYTATWNTGAYLRETFQSLVDQAYPNWEWVVLDDDSTDGTWASLLQYAKEDPRVKPFKSGRNLAKIGATKDAATRLCHGDFLVELDHDDMLTDFALAEIVGAFKANPDVGMVYSNYCSFFEDGSPHRYETEFWKGRYRDFEYRGKKYLECLQPDVYGCFGPKTEEQNAFHLKAGPNHVRAYRASTFHRLGGYNPKLLVADDWDLFARFFLYSKCFLVEKPLYLYRFKDGRSNTTFVRNRAIQDHLRLGQNRYYEEFKKRHAETAGLPVAKDPEHVENPRSSDGMGISCVVIEAAKATKTIECIESIRKHSPGSTEVMAENKERYRRKYPKIRVVAIAKDEASALPGFVKQWEGLVESISILVDSSTLDTTRDALGGCTWEEAEFKDFASFRNDAVKRHAGGADWVVMLDPDERLDEHTLRHLPELLASTNSDILLAPLEAVFPGGERRRFVTKAFAWRNIPEIRWIFKVHEKLIGSRKQAVVRNALITHVLDLHDPERRKKAEELYRSLSTQEPYFTDPAYKKKVCVEWPILDYDRPEDGRLGSVYAGPLISVVIPTYKRKGLLIRAADSALNQDYPNVDVVVVGDACPELPDLAITKPIKDDRLRILNLNENHGAGGAVPRNHGICAAAGELIAYLDDDNLWAPNHLSSLYEAMRLSGAEYALSSMRLDSLDVDLDFPEPKRGSVDTSCILHKKALVAKYGFWKSREEAGDYAHDWEFVSRWSSEKWAATGLPTLVYNVETCGQREFLTKMAEAKRGAAK